MANYEIKAITSLLELKEVRGLWEENQWHPNADFEFFSLIVSTRPQIISPCVFVLSQKGKAISLLAGRIEHATMPLRLGYATLARLPVRRIVIIEGAFMGDRSESNWSALLLFMDRFLIRGAIDYAFFEQVHIGSSFHTRAREMFSSDRFKPAHEPSEHWLMSLPESWDAFLKTRSKKHRYWLKRLENILNKEFPGKWTIRRYTLAAETGEFLRAAETIAKTTYHRSLAVGFSLNEENEKRINLEARRDQLRGYILFINDEPKAFWYCTIYQKRLYLCSTGYLPDLRSYEVGTILLMKVFRDHCGSNVDMVDFGLGEAGYKQRFGSEHFSEASHALFAQSARGRWLSSTQQLMQLLTKGAKGTLDRLNITQKFKTMWRRKLEEKSAAVPRESEPQSGNVAGEPVFKSHDSGES
jgi:hypothetical protein